MLADNRDVIADILDGLALHFCAAGDCVAEGRAEHGADALRWTAEYESGSPEDIAYALEKAEEETVRLTDEVVELKAERDDVRLYVKALKKALDALPDLIEAVSAETPHEDCGECAVTRLVVAVDEARQAAKDAVKAVAP